jgi:hydrogenase maturation factor
LARGHVDGTPVEISVELLDGAAPGDVVLAHGGVALQRVDTGEVSA